MNEWISQEIQPASFLSCFSVRTNNYGTQNLPQVSCTISGEIKPMHIYQKATEKLLWQKSRMYKFRWKNVRILRGDSVNVEIELERSRVCVTPPYLMNYTISSSVLILSREGNLYVTDQNCIFGHECGLHKGRNSCSMLYPQCPELYLALCALKHIHWINEQKSFQNHSENHSGWNDIPSCPRTNWLADYLGIIPG